MKLKLILRVVIVVAMAFFPASQAFSSKEGSLEIIKPALMETLVSSNVEIEVCFDFGIAENLNPFRAWLNGKSVESLFILSDDGLTATALLSVKDGVKASEDHG